jgi:ABC-2 type transport system ATP-binding protein
VRLIDIHKSYGETKALDGAALHVEPGQVMALLGPNGAGKSTILSIAAGLIEADEGKIELEPEVRIGLMPQEHAVYPVLTARENLTFVARAVGLGKAAAVKEVDRVLARVGLSDRAEERVGRFSGGMKRRIGFAAAILGDPKILLLDEPTVGVDPQSRLSLLELVEEQAAEGVGIVYSTHYMEEAERIAHRVTVLHQGQVRAESTVQELIDSQGESQLEVELRGTDRERLTKAVTVHPAGRDAELLETPEPDALTLRTAVSDWNAVVGLLGEIARFARVEAVRIDEPTLESAFLALTGLRK